jgi:hypothetical protein
MSNNPERIQVSTPTNSSTIIFHATGQSEPSPVPPTPVVKTGSESIAANGSVSHPQISGTVAGNVKVSNLG